MGQTCNGQSNRETISTYYYRLQGDGADIAKIVPTPDCQRHILAKP
jgi:hypothetical protein